MVTGRVPPELLHPELRLAQQSETRSEDAELAKWKAVELFKVRESFQGRHDTSLHVDHGEFSPSDGSRHRHQRQVDSDADSSVRRSR